MPQVRVVGWLVGGLSLVCILGLAGCWSLNQRSANLSKLTPPYRVEIYEGGRPGAQQAIASGSPQEVAITRWLQDHESGWRTDLNSYAPAHCIKGDRFNLNFSGRVCVMNYDPDGDGKQVQVSRTIEDSDALPPSVFAPDH